MKPGELEKLQAVENGLYKTFKLMTPIPTGQMHAFDSNSCLRKYETPMDMIKEFYGVRYKYYQLRKDYLIGQYGAVANSLSARARFIEEKCAGTLVVENKKRKDLMKELVKRGYPSDPIAEWKKRVPQDHESGTGGRGAAGGSDEEEDTSDDGGYDFNYLVGMSMWFLTEEKKQQLLREREQKLAELSKLKMLSLEQMWLDDLSELEVALDAHEKKELLELENAGKGKVKGAGKKGVKAEPVAKGRKKGANNSALEDFKPSADATKIDFQLSDAEKAKYVKAEPKAPAVKKEKGAAGVKLEKNADGSMVEVAAAAAAGEDDLDALIAGKKKAAPAAAGAKKVTAVKKEKSDGMKQSKLDFSGSKKKATTPKQRKKKKGSDDEEDDLSGNESNSDVEFAIEDVVPARERPGGRAASKKITYKFDDDEEEEKSDGEPELFDNTMVSEGTGAEKGAFSDSDVEEVNGKDNTSAEDMFDSLREEETPVKKKAAAAPKKKAEPKAAPAGKRKPGSDEEVTKKVRERERERESIRVGFCNIDFCFLFYFQAPAKKKKKLVSDSEEEEEDGSDDDFSPVKKAGGAKKKAAAGGGKKKKVVSDSDSDFDDY